MNSNGRVPEDRMRPDLVAEQFIQLDPSRMNQMVHTLVVSLSLNTVTELSRRLAIVVDDLNGGDEPFHLSQGDALAGKVHAGNVKPSEKPHTRLRPKDRDEILRRYEAGESRKEIADAVGTRYQNVVRVILMAKKEQTE